LKKQVLIIYHLTDDKMLKVTLLGPGLGGSSVAMKKGGMIMQKCVTTAIALACLPLLLIVPGQASDPDCPDDMLFKYGEKIMPYKASDYCECWDLNHRLDGKKIIGSIHQSDYFEAVIERPDGNCRFSKTYSNTSWKIKGTEIVLNGKTLRVDLKRPVDTSIGGVGTTSFDCRCY